MMAADVLSAFTPGVRLTAKDVGRLAGIHASSAIQRLRRLAEQGQLESCLSPTKSTTGQRAAIFWRPENPPPLPGPKGDWTADRIAMAKRLYIDGHSAAQIASVLKVTRNAVIGQLTRAGVTRSPRAGAVASRNNQRAVVRPKKALPGLRLGPGHNTTEQPAQPTLSFGKAFLPLPGSTPRPLIEMERGLCRWPLRIDGEHFACCLPAIREEGRPWRYCEAHTSIAVKATQPKPLKAFNPDAPRRRAA
ncbi:MAG: GcrA cell cycle regulator [Novosphingobium sp.]|nr:GcrA cell cycle regulator [Novosphingobium sp.]